MGTDLLDVSSELLTGSTETMRRALQRPETETLSARDAGNLLRHSKYVLSLIARIERKSRRALASGIEGSLFGRVCGDMIQAIGRFSALAEELEREIRRQPASIHRRRRLADVKAVESEAARYHRLYQGWLASSSRPARPIDWVAVAEAEAAHARGEHRPASEFEADLAARKGE